MASWFTRKWRGLKHFIGRKVIPGVTKAARWIGQKALPFVMKRVLPVIGGIASNPLVQAGANALLPGSGAALAGIGMGAGFARQVYDSVSGLPGKSTLGAIRAGNVAGATQGIVQTGQTLADLHSQYKQIRANAPRGPDGAFLD